MQSFYGPAMELSSTASKLDMSLAWFPALADQAALGVFRTFGITPLLERNAALSQRLHNALVAHGWGARLFDDGERSTIFSIPVSDADRAMIALRDAGVVASVRSGRVRLATHFYNREEEIDRVVELLSAV
jgi:selenocysteine lyase/cysteine desulfurase